MFLCLRFLHILLWSSHLWTSCIQQKKVSLETILQIHQSLHSLSSVVWHFQTFVPEKKRHNLMFTRLYPLLFNYPKEWQPLFTGNLFCIFMALLYNLIVLTTMKSFLYIVWNISSRLTSSITKWWRKILEDIASSITATQLQPMNFLPTIIIGYTMHQPSLVW